jgi:hypothetical protein
VLLALAIDALDAAQVLPSGRPSRANAPGYVDLGESGAGRHTLSPPVPAGTKITEITGNQ